MNKTLLATLVATLVLSVAPMSAPVASSAIQRCQSADGQLVYTDKACAVFGAKAVPMTGELLTSIAREDSRESQAPVGLADADTPLNDADTPLDSAVNVSRRSPGSGCARTPTQLAMDLRGALALGDINRVAESYHWVGLSNKQGYRVLERLQRLIGKTVVDSHYIDAQISSSTFGADAGASWVATSSNNGIGGGAGVLQVVLGHGASTSIVDFDVEHYAECYFVKF